MSRQFCLIFCWDQLDGDQKDQEIIHAQLLGQHHHLHHPFHQHPLHPFHHLPHPFQSHHPHHLHHQHLTNSHCLLTLLHHHLHLLHPSQVHLQDHPHPYLHLLKEEELDSIIRALNQKSTISNLSGTQMDHGDQLKNTDINDNN